MHVNLRRYYWKEIEKWCLDNNKSKVKPPKSLVRKINKALSNFPQCDDLDSIFEWWNGFVESSLSDFELKYIISCCQADSKTQLIGLPPWLKNIQQGA